MTKVLVVGSGGREHALAWSLSKSRSVGSIIAAPGNPGIAEVAECFDAAADDIEAILGVARSHRPDLVVVGPEVPLVAGLADALRAEGLDAFGPSKAAAMVEGSKAFAKKLMAMRQIPTAASEDFSDPGAAKDYVRRSPGPVVVKADGLAAGKGVIVCDDESEALEAIEAVMTRRLFGDAGRSVVVEERMIGEELSVLAFVHGKTVLPMDAAQDFKRALDGDEGANTGGMGSFSPIDGLSPDVSKSALEDILIPMADVIDEQAGPYIGVLYAGLMLTDDGLKVVEFNCRFGDPETQALLPRMDADLGEVMIATVRGELEGARLGWAQDHCVCVVMASNGYPDGPLQTGEPIRGLDAASAVTGIPVFHAGTVMKDGRLVNASGRVLGVTAVGPSTADARERAYKAVHQISFAGMRYRKDIAATY